MRYLIKGLKERDFAWKAKDLQLQLEWINMDMNMNVSSLIAHCTQNVRKENMLVDPALSLQSANHFFSFTSC